MTETQNFEQSNTDSSTGIQSDIKGGTVYQGHTINVYENKSISDKEQEKSPPPKTNKPQEDGLAFAVFSIAGSIKDPVQLAQLKALVQSLQRVTGDTSLEIVFVEDGSIRVTLKGSPEGIERIKELFERGILEEAVNHLPADTTFNDPLTVCIELFKILDSEPAQKQKVDSNQFKPLLVSAILAKGGKTIKLEKADLSGVNLRGADLSGADLRAPDFSGADLSQADFSGARLTGANLSEARLTGANLIGAILERANLERAGLREGNLEGANLERANLEGAYLRRANLKGANLERANLKRVNLRGVNLRGTNLRGANLRGAIIEANLEEANVENAVFTNARGLTESNKADLKFRGAIFEDSPGERSEVLSPVKR